MLHRVTPTGLEPLEGGSLETMAAGRHVVVDIGTGDAHHAYHRARSSPGVLVVGLDPQAANLHEIAVRSARKPARGGVANLVLVRASVEDLATPDGRPLAGIADEVVVLLPWGRLLAGIVTDDPAVKAGIAAVARPGATVEIVLNNEIWAERTPLDYANLPEASPEHVVSDVVPAFAAVGVAIDEVRYLGRDEAKALRTTWAKRLGHGREHPRFVLLRGRRVA